MLTTVPTTHARMEQRVPTVSTNTRANVLWGTREQNAVLVCYWISNVSLDVNNLLLINRPSHRDRRPDIIPKILAHLINSQGLNLKLGL